MQKKKKKNYNQKKLKKWDPQLGEEQHTLTLHFIL